jgi:hypothetical protein
VPLVAPLVALDVFVIVLWCIAAALAIALIVKYIADVFRVVPVVGGAIAGALDAVGQAITSAAGKLVSKSEQLLGSGLHAFARYLDTFWHQWVSVHSILLQLAEHIGQLIYSHSGLRALVQRLEKVWHGVEHGVKDLTRKWHGIDRRVHKIERELANGIGNDVRSQVKALEREVTGIEQGVIPDLRAGIKTAEGEVTALERFIKALPGTRYLDWAAGIVAAALGAGFFNAFRCSAFSKILGRGCNGIWGGLEDLLGLFIDLLLITNICELLPPLEALVSEVADPIVVGLTDVGAGLCSGGIGAAPALKVPALSLPANPGLTLNLP